MAPKDYWKNEKARFKKALVDEPLDAVKNAGKELGHDLDMARMQSGFDPTLLHSDLPEDETLAFLRGKKGKGAERG